jgi:DNA-binding MarR family transcriptional regulator
MAGRVQQEIRQSKPLAPAHEAALNIQRTATLLRQEVERTTGLKHAEYNILRILRGAGADGLHADEIKERLLTEEPMLLGYIGSLAQRGLVAPGVQKRAITAEGIRVLAELDDRVTRMMEARMDRLTGAELRSLIDTLEKLRG